MRSNTNCDFVDVDQKNFEQYAPKSFENLLEGFREYKTCA